VIRRPAGLADNQTYYFTVGQGVWRGHFSFRLTDSHALRRDRIGLKTRLLARGMQFVQRLLGDSRLDSLYLLNEQYTLNSDGRGVVVNAQERFGPIPFLSSTYWMPLLGTDWTAEYTVARSRGEIAGVLRCPWAECTESMAET
jgi:hypothetical protein